MVTTFDDHAHSSNACAFASQLITASTVSWLMAEAGTYT